MKHYRSKPKAKQETLKTSQLQCTIKPTQNKLKKRKNKSENRCRKKSFRSIRKKRRCTYKKKSVSLRTLLKSEKLKAYINSLKSQNSPIKEDIQISSNAAKQTNHENKTKLTSQLIYNDNGLNITKPYATGSNYTESFAHSSQPVYDYQNYYANYDYSCGNEYKFYDTSAYFQSYPQQYNAYYNVNNSSFLINPNDYKYVPVKHEPEKLKNQTFVVCKKVPCGKYQPRSAPGYFKDVFDDVEINDVSTYLNENKDMSNNLNGINNMINEQLHLQILKREEKFESVNENNLDASTEDSLVRDLIIEQPSYKCETRNKNLIYEPVL